jgi:parvulin-like peptidyl-prolyl isomerase
MSRRQKRIDPHSLLWVGLLALLSACRPGGGEDPWIAEVDDQQIPFSELRPIVMARFEEDPQANRDDVLNEELNRLVTEQVILNRAGELGIVVTKREVEVRLHQLHGNDFDGMDPQFVAEVRRQMLLERTELVDLAARIEVPESAIVLYFEENRQRYRSPESVQIRQIVVEDEETARGLLSDLRKGADFAALAEEHSLAPEAGEGGLLPPFARGEMPEVFDRAFKSKKGALSGVVESPYGFHIFRVEAKIPPHEPKLAEMRNQVRIELEQKRLAELRKGWLRGLRRSADIRVNEPLLETLR